MIVYLAGRCIAVREDGKDGIGGEQDKLILLTCS